MHRKYIDEGKIMVGKLIIVSGLSGSGKTTLVEHVLDTFSKAAKVISCTTRAMRAGEQDGVHYNFYSRKEFHARRKRGEFAEYKPNVYGNMYGTRKEDIEAACTTHSAVILVVDIQGVKTLSEIYPSARKIFISTQTEELSRRLRERNTSPEDIQKRIATAKREMAKARSQHFDCVIENDHGKLDEAQKNFCILVKEIIGIGKLSIL